MKLWFVSTFLILISIDQNESKRSNTNARNSKRLITDERQAEIFLGNANRKLAIEKKKSELADWNYHADMSPENEAKKVKSVQAFSKFLKELAMEAKNFDWSHFSEYNQKQFIHLVLIRDSILEGKDSANFAKTSSELTNLYGSAKICVQERCNLTLDPEITELMEKSRNYDILEEIWVKWRDASGKKMRDKYITILSLSNKAARMNKLPNKSFRSMDEMWLYEWDTPDLKRTVDELWKQLRPLYEKLHTWVRLKLKEEFPDRMPEDGTIPAHLTGNMWAQEWSSLMRTVEHFDPFPDLDPIDVTEELQKQKYTVNKMFKTAEKFFQDLGFSKMTKLFWDKSILSKPTDGRELVCHASAFDMVVKNDFRIRMCTKVNHWDFTVVHHEMGHIHYFMLYSIQPAIFRIGANPGFHEAIGDMIALSVQTPKHLHKMKLIKNLPKDLKTMNIKFQLNMALKKLAFLPFGLLVDKWRWDVLSGKVSTDDMNRHWWKLRLEIQGISPPVKRSEDDFDPGAKYHIPGNSEYVSYFVSHILQFQFHKALCNIAQPGVPLYECDIGGNKKAGKKFMDMLKLGSSVKWQYQLQRLTGSKDMDVGPLLEYFEPLIKFLDEELEGQDIGWEANVDDYFE